MPFKSAKQMRWMYANKPDLAKKWEDKYGAFKSKKSVAKYHKNRGK